MTISRTRFMAAAALGSALCLLSPDVSRAAASPLVKLVPPDKAVKAGATFTVAVKIRGAKGVGSVPFTLYYDPMVLEFVETASSEGGFLRQGGTRTLFVASPGSTSRGGGVVVGHSRLGSTTGARGKGTLCRIAFRARQPGVSQLIFARASLLDPSAAPLPATFRGTTIKVGAAR